jgi:hypothetical protein
LPFSNTKFGWKLKSVVDIHKTTQNNKTVRYYMIKNDVKTNIILKMMKWLIIKLFYQSIQVLIVTFLMVY